eukprot:5403024-Pyramimonas_sp.AAC.1
MRSAARKAHDGQYIRGSAFCGSLTSCRTRDTSASDAERRTQGTRRSIYPRLCFSTSRWREAAQRLHPLVFHIIAIGEVERGERCAASQLEVRAL